MVALLILTYLLGLGGRELFFLFTYTRVGADFLLITVHFYVYVSSELGIPFQDANSLCSLAPS